ncbi:hypothetical protein [Marinomonas foliarum]|uniref:Uncharacterized protein n=1 Tax=Marinomonas foliarum TaxID=491950 RepID=A0ABX7IQ21_9GAMM|nr:hypothetical protein [Marinomonas foliarum]QRV24355.1 hypothetical protein JSY38_02105 [Marinomonas foliarum]
MNMKVATLFLSVLISSKVYAEYPQIYVHGVPLSCTASNGQTVLFYDHPGAAQAAKQLGGARADFTPQYGFTIALDPQLMNSLPFLGAIFVVYHECAHVALPMGVGLMSPSQERNADCYAIQAMRDHGFIKSWDDFNQAMSAVIVSGGAHFMSQKRINAIAQCL